MPQAPFEARWDLSDAQRAEVRAIKGGLGEIERARALLAAIETQLHAQAYKMAVDTLLAMPGRPSSYEVPIRSMAADVASVSRVSDATVRARMEEAARMIQLFPAVYAALSDARVSPAHARAICDEGMRLDDADLRARYADTALSLADTTVAKLRRICQVVAERLAPTPLTERHEAAVAGRSVWASPAADGMTEIHVLVETALAEGIIDRTTELARTVLAGRADDPADPADTAEGSEKDPRTLAQARADVITDLLLTAVPTGHGDGLDQIKATVQVTIPAEVLTERLDLPSCTGGGGVVAPTTARRLAAHTFLWSRLFRDPQTGALVTTDSYVPTAEQRRFLYARDEHCRFPGCRRAIRRCDLDHIHDYARGGKTSVCNLSGLCRAHHVVKHHSPWSCRRTSDGSLEWVTPTGQVLREQETPAVRFRVLHGLAGPPPF
ncbi:HNH endonuclease signature motif containing protein [Microbacterium stercoris]|uniref:DUF222 domain-containing protein n=1 Tax=Microbacterium stercoris TaxID=2820289 RepID=A0A939QHC4_9MICO|nr:HNH endonuclease signature motif containing protein [Microbacterium stercoris]MBO3662947.1 DUF222 domain-containing protein [Microbacterium stercoris]